MTNEEMLKCVCMEYEKKLKKLMGEEKFHKYSIKVARDLFFKEITNSPSAEFRNFALDNFELITAMPGDDGLDFPDDEEDDDGTDADL